MMPDIGTLVQFALIILVLSQTLYKHTILYRIAESTYIGVAMATVLVNNLYAIRDKGLTKIAMGEPLYLIILVLGILTLTRISKEYSWLSRYPMALMIGAGLGISMRASVETNILKMAEATMLPLFGGTVNIIDNFLTVLIVISILVYFTFTMKQSTTTNYVSKFGRYSLLIGFGAFFGNAVIGRTTWLSSIIGTLVETVKIFLSG